VTIVFTPPAHSAYLSRAIYGGKHNVYECAQRSGKSELLRISGLRLLGKGGASRASSRSLQMFLQGPRGSVSSGVSAQYIVVKSRPSGGSETLRKSPRTVLADTGDLGPLRQQ
jgi:hypothetical protein